MKIDFNGRRRRIVDLLILRAPFAFDSTD